MRELSGAARAHFDQPCHVGALDVDAPNVATVRVGEPASGTILQLHLRIGADGSITAARFKAYGCGWLIACGSLLVERLQGRTLKQAARLRHHELVETLDVPPEKLYCAVLAETALKKALRACPAQPTPPVAIQSDHL